MKTVIRVMQMIAVFVFGSALYTVHQVSSGEMTLTRGDQVLWLLVTAGFALTWIATSLVLTRRG